MNKLLLKLKRKIRKMFNNNECLRGCDEKYEMTPERKKEWIKCAEDPLYFIENYFYIITTCMGSEVRVLSAAPLSNRYLTSQNRRGTSPLWNQLIKLSIE